MRAVSSRFNACCRHHTEHNGCCSPVWRYTSHTSSNARITLALVGLNWRWGAHNGAFHHHGSVCHHGYSHYHRHHRHHRLERRRGKAWCQGINPQARDTQGAQAIGTLCGHWLPSNPLGQPRCKDPHGVPLVCCAPLGCSPRVLWLQDYVGPTEESNWVLLGRMLVGAYPSSQDDALNDQILTSILQLGVTTFVCLQVRLLPGATVRCGGVVCLHSWASHLLCCGLRAVGTDQAEYEHTGVTGELTALTGWHTSEQTSITWSLTPTHAPPKPRG